MELRHLLNMAFRFLAVVWVSCNTNAAAATHEQTSDYWVQPMKQVHARFTGEKGTFAHFGDSITVTMAFWTPLAYDPRGLSATASQSLKLVMSHMKPKCWREWKGAEYGNTGMMTIRWAHENVNDWLKRLNPEVVLIMFGSNDVGQMPVQQYEQKTREVVERCLANGSIVILTTMPPRSGLLEKSRTFADAVKRIAREKKTPLIDYFGEILIRRPDDWDGSLPKFKDTPGDEYQAPTLICRDGVHPSNPGTHQDYSEESLRTNGYVLRNYLTLLAYADVIQKILQ
jgi:hypothetical protein